MKVSKELENYILDIVSKAVKETKDGNDSAGYANAILMATKAYGFFYSLEQAEAVNMTQTYIKKEVEDGKGKSKSKN